jgi:branched-chain amino acid transport system substrate-binding protein
MIKKIFFGIGSILLFLSMLLSWPSLTVCAGSGENVKVGVVLPLTGPPAAMGIGGKQALETYFDWINSKGGINSLDGAKIEMILVDTTAQPDVGVTQAERLINRENVDALIGCYQSSVTLPVSSVAQRYQVPMISFAGNSDKILQRGNNWIIRPGPWASGTAYSRLQAVSELNDLMNVQNEKIGVLYIDDEWGQAGEKAIKDQAPHFNFDVAISQPYPHGVSDFTSIVTKFKTHNPVAILANAYGPETLLFLRTRYQMDMAGGIFCISGIHDPGFMPSAGRTARYLFCNVSSGDWLIPSKSSKVIELFNEYKKRYPDSAKTFGGGEGEFFGFQCGQCLVQALEKAGSTDNKKLMQALSTLKIPAKDLLTPYSIEITSDFMGMKGQNKKGILPIEQYDKELQPHIVSPAEVREKAYDPIWPVSKPSKWD